jgi:DNA-binding PadR family transcriptional regulator
MFFGKRFSGHHRQGLLSGLDMLVLSIVKSNSKTGITGYDLIQKINKKFKGLWKASAGTIYPLLGRLSSKDLVNIEEVSENNRQKKLYKISETGINELKKVLEHDLQPSITTLNDFIQTIVGAIPSFSCFTPPDIHDYCMVIPEIKGEINEYSRIKQAITKLENAKIRLKKRLEKIDGKIIQYKSILEKVEEKRSENARIIEIVEDDDEFDKF